jgi:hypothetical protein
MTPVNSMEWPEPIKWTVSCQEIECIKSINNNRFWLHSCQRSVSKFNYSQCSICGGNLIVWLGVKTAVKTTPPTTSLATQRKPLFFLNLTQKLKIQIVIYSTKKGGEITIVLTPCYPRIDMNVGHIGEIGINQAVIRIIITKKMWFKMNTGQNKSSLK